MNKAAKRFYGVLISFILIVMSIVILFSFIIPAISEIKQLRGEREALAELLEEEKSTIETVNRLLSENESVSGLQRSVSLSLPTKEEVPEVINQLNGIAKLSGVAVESLNIELLPIRPTSDTSAIEPVGTMRITINIRGNYDGIKDYIGFLETNVRIIDMDTLLVSGGTEGDSLGYKITVDTYYQR